MKHFDTVALAVAASLSLVTGTYAQQPAATSADVYHVHFTKAVPGQAAALGTALGTQDPKAAMPGHLVVLRHQQGDDWDYCVIEHLGARATVDPATRGPAPGRDLRAWHTDTFVSGPPWAEFADAIGLTASAAGTGGSVYSVSVWRAAPGHRDQLEEALRQADPTSKVPVRHIVLQHLEGGPWQFMAIDRYNSWQDFATDRTASAAGTATGKDPWSQVREHSTYHHDTLADRVMPKQ